LDCSTKNYDEIEFSSPILKNFVVGDTFVFIPSGRMCVSCKKDTLGFISKSGVKIVVCNHKDIEFFKEQFKKSNLLIDERCIFSDVLFQQVGKYTITYVKVTRSGFSIIALIE
jgi:hypothetical protein